MNELKLQSLIIDQIVSEGGHGRKLSHRFLVGIPDLLLRLSLPRSAKGAMVLVEVKLLRVSEDYDLTREPKIGVTPKQTLELTRFEHSCVAVGVQRGYTLSSIHIIQNHFVTLPKSAANRMAAVKKGKILSPLTPMFMETIYGSTC